VFEWDPDWKPSERPAVVIAEDTGMAESESSPGGEDEGDAPAP